MDSLVLFILMVAGVLLSAIVSKYIPQIPLALIQIMIGLLLAIVPIEQTTIHFEPELFMIGIIAPLVFYEGQNISRKELWKLRGPILLLAFGLVLLLVVAGGFLIHWLIPNLPLPVSFALSAIVSPTDTVALKSIVKNIKLPDNIMAVLEGESLINDAAGLVSFKVALGVVLTGYFSVKEASFEFLIAAFGGIIFGGIVGFLFVKLRLQLRKMRLEQTELLVLIQLITPFTIFIAAERLEFSGVLAMVAAGVVHGVEHDHLQATTTKIQMVSNNVWGTVVYFLNSLVFLLLGATLPSVVAKIWSKENFLVEELLGLALIISLFLMAVRFIWVYLLHEHFVEPNAMKFEDYFKSFVLGAEKKQVDQISRGKYALITTLAGVHGTISLATALSIPLVLTNGQAFPLRNELLFITAMIILISLVSATIFLPLILPKEELPEVSTNFLDFKTAYALLLKQTSQQLEAKRTTSNQYYINQTIVELTHKLADTEEVSLREMDKKQVKQLLNYANTIQSKTIDDLYKNNVISKQTHELFAAFSAASKQFEEKNFIKKIFFRLKFSLLRNRLNHMEEKEIKEHFNSRFKNNQLIMDEFKLAQKISAEATIQALQNQMNTANRKETLRVIQRYNRFMKQSQDDLEEVEESNYYARLALQIQREIVQRMMDEKMIDYPVANQIGEQIGYDELSELALGTE